MTGPLVWKLLRATAPAAPFLFGMGYAAGRLAIRPLRDYLNRPEIIDQQLARRVARAVHRPAGGAAFSPTWADLAGRQCSEQLAEALGINWLAEHPVKAIEPLDWIDLNLVRFAQLLQSLDGPARKGIDNPFARVAVSVQVGILLGYLASRVMGQYDVKLFGGDHTTYVVEANVDSLARRMGVDRDQLWRWVALHELTHALEFERAAWLPDHLRGLIASYFSDDRPDDATATKDDEAAGGLLAMALSGNQRAMISRTQACMCVLEGYSNLVMREVGRSVLGEYPRIDAAMRSREKSRSLFTNLVLRLLGLGLKMDQYRMGERFCRHVFEEAGMEAVDLVWRRPANLPDLAEIADPDRWLTRMRESLPESETGQPSR